MTSTFIGGEKQACISEGVNPPADIASGRIAEVRSRSMSCNCMTRTSQQECRGILEYYSIVKKGQLVKAKRTNIIKKQGTKTLAGILAVGMTFGTPISVLADDNISDSTMEQQAGVQNVLAKKVDGSETLVKVSEVVLRMIQRNEVKLDTDKFLKDVTTGQKVDPTTGERVTELGTPVEPSEPEIPTTPT